MANFPCHADQLIACIRDAWGVDELLSTWPQQKVAELVANRYSQASWNLRL